MTSNTRGRLREQVSETLEGSIRPYITPGVPLKDVVDTILNLIRDNITLGWVEAGGYWLSRAIGERVEVHPGQSGSWYVCWGDDLVLESHKGESKFESLEEAKAAALEHYRNTILSEIGG